MLFVCILLFLHIFRVIQAASESNDDTSDKRIASHFSSELNWGAKKARTIRYEVVEAKKDQSEKCFICRPGCVHWNLLSRSKRKSEGTRWIRSKQTAEQKRIYLARHKLLKQQRYANLTIKQKKERQARTSALRRIQVNKMTAEQKKAYWKKNREYTLNKMKSQ